jgi:type I restriction enzyme M protein
MKLFEESELIQSSISYLRNELGFSLIDYEIPFNIGKTKNRADIVVYKAENGKEKPYILVEVKKQDKIGKYAWIQAESYAKRLNTPYFAVTNGNEWQWFKTGKIGESDKININQIDLSGTDVGKITIKDQKQFLKVFDQMKRILYVSENLRSNKALCELIKIIFVKLEYEKDINKKNSLIDEDKSLTQGINDFYQIKLKKYPKLIDSELNEKFFRINLTEQTISKLISFLDQFKFIDSDVTECFNLNLPILGYTYENELGYFFTPRELSKFIVNFINPSIDNSILNPACKNGDLLIEAIKKNCEELKSSEKPENIKDNISKKIHGIEDNPELYWFTCMNLILQGYSAEGISLTDTLNLEENDEYDILFVIPPFGPINRFNKINFISDENLRISSIEEAFLLKSIKLLKNSGQMSIILPDRVLTSPSARLLRKYLKEKMNILSIISLPSNIFIRNNIKTSILFLEKKEEGFSKQKTVFMVDFQTKRQLNEKDFNNILEDYILFKKTNLKKGRINENSFAVNEDLIIENDILSPSYYNSEYLEIKNQLKKLKNHEKLEDIGEISIGQRFKENCESSESSIPLIKIKNIVDGEISKKDLKFIEINNPRTKLWSPGTLIISRIGQKNKIAILPPDFPKYTLDQNLIGIKLEKNVIPEYLALFLNSKYGTIQLESIKVSGIIPYLIVSLLKEIIIPLTSIEAQKKILNFENRNDNIFLKEEN